jgi:hypothetical protein
MEGIRFSDQNKAPPPELIIGGCQCAEFNALILVANLFSKILALSPISQNFKASNLSKTLTLRAKFFIH